MEFKLHNGKNGQIAEFISEKILHGMDDFLDLIGNIYYQGTEKIIIRKINLQDDFFDLKTKIAGDVLQKFSTYNLRLAIIGDFSKIKSNSLSDFIRESNQVGRVVFVESLLQALEKLD